MDFLAGDSILAYVVIFLGKFLEVTLDTLRIVMVNKGKRATAAMIAFVVMTIWLIIIGSVMDSINGNPLKMVIYALAYSMGNFFGMSLESKLAMGLCSIQVIVDYADGYVLVNKLRDSGFGVTVIDGESYNGKRHLVYVHLKRKRINEAVRIIGEISSSSVTIINDVRSLRGGYVTSKRY